LFASAFKHLAESGIDMAAFWYLKDGIYGIIYPANKLRSAANVFAWGNKYLIGKVIKTQISAKKFLFTLSMKAVLKTIG
jgi:hypothetical protein